MLRISISIAVVIVTLCRLSSVLQRVLLIALHSIETTAITMPIFEYIIISYELMKWNCNVLPPGNARVDSALTNPAQLIFNSCQTPGPRCYARTTFHSTDGGRFKWIASRLMNTNRCRWIRSAVFLSLGRDDCGAFVLIRHGRPQMWCAHRKTRNLTSWPRFMCAARRSHFTFSPPISVLVSPLSEPTWSFRHTCFEAVGKMGKMKAILCLFVVEYLKVFNFRVDNAASA